MGGRFCVPMSPSNGQHNGKHPGGRPSKYNPVYCFKLLAYFEAGGRGFFKPIVVSNGANAGSEIVDHDMGQLPAYFEGFAHHIGVTHDTLLEWCKVHPEFSESYKKAKAIQLRQLADGLLSQQYSAAGAIFLLKNAHGYRDRQPDESQPTHVNVNVSVTMIDGLKQIAAHRTDRLSGAFTTDLGHAES